jgi:chorismate mutase
MQANYTLAKDPLSLETIRSILNRLEDTIIFSLIERAQFAHNPKIYEPGVFRELEALQFEGSWLEWFLKETEAFHGALPFPQLIRSRTAHSPLDRDRSESAEIYKASAIPSPRELEGVPRLTSNKKIHSPDEYPFTTGLPDPVLPPLEHPPILYPNKVNVNPSILSFYVRSIIPRVTAQASFAIASLKRFKGIADDNELEDDGNYGSAATVDVEVLQAISKRVHYGLSLFPSFPPHKHTHLTLHSPSHRQICVRVQVPARPRRIHHAHPTARRRSARRAHHEARG